MVNFGLLTADIGSPVWGTTTNFNGFWVSGFVTAPTSLTAVEVNQTLHDVWPSPGLIHYIYITFCPLTEFCQRQNYWRRYCTALEQWALAKICGVISSRDMVTIPFDIGRSNCLVAVNFGAAQRLAATVCGCLSKHTCVLRQQLRSFSRGYTWTLLWSLYGIGQTIIFLPCGFFFFLFFLA